MNRQTLKKYKLPDKPGIYIFKSGPKILYIGKATSLCDRVRSYFSKDLFNTRGPMIVDMVTKATGLKWQTTDSVLEALILEANLIKKHQPHYNVKEKDDKSWNYVCITDEKIPLVVILREKNLAQKLSLRSDLGPKRGPTFSRVFGPYTSGSSLREALKIIRRIFPFLDEKSKNYFEFYKQINLVPDTENEKHYLSNIKNIKLFFAGKKGLVLKNLEKEMKVFAKKQKFEQACEIKKQIFALKHIQDVALIKDETVSSRLNLRDSRGLTSSRPFRIEAYDVAHMSGKYMVGVMTVLENSEFNKNEYRKFKIRDFNKSNDTGALREILDRRFSHPEWPYPKLIVVDGGKAQLNTALNFQKKVGLGIPVVAVVKDERHQPKNILGDKKLIQKYEKEILLANTEAHRFAIKYHRGIMKL